MAFKDDNGGFTFSCEDAKMSICASTWSTRLSQLERIDGPVYIMTNTLPNLEYISKIIGKRPRDIFIIANTSAHYEAQQLKNQFPMLQIALNDRMNAKVVLVAPETVWISSADFGKTDKIESAIGLHSSKAFGKAHESLFKDIWKKSRILL